MSNRLPEAWGGAVTVQAARGLGWSCDGAGRKVKPQHWGLVGRPEPGVRGFEAMELSREEHLRGAMVPSAGVPLGWWRADEPLAPAASYLSTPNLHRFEGFKNPAAGLPVL